MFVTVFLAVLYFVGYSASAPSPAGTSRPRGAPTIIHVNKGCIRVNNVNLCASNGGSVYPDHVAVHEDRAVIYALFNSMGNEEKSTPRCELNARWPAGSGDIYFSEDSCLRDSTAQKIQNQCCNAIPDIPSPIPNPYFSG